MGNKEETLRELEKRTYMSWHRDGLADLGIGILVALFGLGMKIDLVLMAPIYGCVGYPIWLILKQRITEPRLGWVEFGERRKRRERRGWTMAFVLGCVTLVVAIGGYAMTIGGRGSGLPEFLLISMIFVILTSTLGIILQLVRMHVYSGVILMLGAAGHVYGWKPETGILLPGIMIVISGTIMLVTFLAKYPLAGNDSETSASKPKQDQ